MVPQSQSVNLACEFSRRQDGRKPGAGQGAAGRSGREPKQDIELTCEEFIQEYLQGGKIVDYQFDEERKACSATAVMPNGWVQPKCLPAA